MSRLWTPPLVALALLVAPGLVLAQDKDEATSLEAAFGSLDTILQSEAAA